ncbi:hypothetical protein SLEP1_g25779 [Rubroshorea leprosula]|uniref:Uncharacterized protein n=1 Tax=Rubroshorea leprosula TaxID=152421 RepID=A0AAV5JK79_9ROSI|nr:hypothetical protein SLEP1_g25779 [Rubroshorea leprosula]
MWQANYEYLRQFFSDVGGVSSISILHEKITGKSKSYLKFEQSSGDPARVQILYERVITEFPISSSLWFDYTRYLDKTLKFGSVVRDVYSRATRNCPWIGLLWVRYLLSLEGGHASTVVSD